MTTTIWTIEGLFGLIVEIFDELYHADRAWNACGCGESVRETIDEAIHTYRQEVEKMNEKVEKLFHGDTTTCNRNCDSNGENEDANFNGKTEEVKPVQIETKNKCEQAVELINEAKRNIESCMNFLGTNECQLERSMDAIKVALMDIECQKCELGVMLSKLDDALRKLK